MPKILIADDEPAILKQVLARLQKAGYEVDTAKDGKEALVKLCGAVVAYDLLISDVMMPEMDGFELLVKVRCDPPLMDLPVIMLTAMPNEVAGFNQARQNKFVRESAKTACVYKVSGVKRWGSDWKDTLVEVTTLMLETPELQSR